MAWWGVALLLFMAPQALILGDAGGSETPRLDAPIIIDSMDALCGPGGLALDCDVAGNATDPYVVPGHRITQTAKGCGQEAAIMVCGLDVHVRLQGFDVEVPRLAGPAVYVGSPVQIADSTLAGGEPTIAQDASLWVWESQIKVSGSQGIVQHAGGLRVEDSDIRGAGGITLVSVSGAFQIHRSTLHGALLSAIDGTGHGSITGSAFRDNGVPARPELAGGQTRHSADIVLGDGTLVVAGTTFDVEEAAIVRDAGLVLNVTGSSFTGPPGSNAIWVSSTTDAICDLHVHHNDIIGPGLSVSGNDCILDARHNWWGDPAGPAPVRNAITEPWLHGPVASLPVIEFERVEQRADRLVLHGAAVGAVRVRADGDTGLRATDVAADGAWSITLPTQATPWRLQACNTEDCSPWVALPQPTILPSTDDAVHWDAWLWAPALLSVPLAAGAVLVTRRRGLRQLEVRLRRELDMRAAEEAAARREMEQWFVGMAHDLKGPVASLVISMEVAAQRAAQGQDISNLMQIQRRSQRQVQGLVDGIVEFTRAGHVAIQRAAVDIRAVLHDALHGISHRHASVAFQGPSIYWDTDARLLSRIIQNLVGNAAREPTCTGIDIRWHVADGLVIDIQDDGPGLPEHILDHLFQPFVDGVGSGMGLATCKRLATSLGGELALTSTSAAGTAWRLRLP